MTDTTHTSDSVQPQEICYRAFDLIRDSQFDDAEKLLSHWMGRREDPVSLALFHSTFGVLEKRRGDFKAALRHYTRAEKLMPEDPAIKLITARLLIDVFHETSKAIKKCQQVRKLLPDNPVVVHQAHTLEGLAHAAKGQRRKAVEALEASHTSQFAGFLTCANIDFHLVEVCVRKRWSLASCQQFLVQAEACAATHNETAWHETITNIRTTLDTALAEA
jgi:tetratricopeptide (TPR) repeat protein